MKIRADFHRLGRRPKKIVASEGGVTDAFRPSAAEDPFLRATSQLRALANTTESFQELRLRAAVAELEKRYPEESAERDKVLLRVLARESRTSADMKRFKHLLHSSDSKCEEYMTYLNGPNQRSKTHPFNGCTFDELCSYLDTSSKLYPKIKELAKPLPSNFHTLYRRTKKKYSDKEIADGKFDSQELFAPGFPLFISAIYSADDPNSIVDFGDTEQKLVMKPEASFIDLWHDETTKHELDDLLKSEGLQRDRFVPLYDLLYKSGIDVCLYRTRNTANWFNIYNPAAIDSVS